MKKLAKKLLNIFFCCLLGLGVVIFAVGCDESGSTGGGKTPTEKAEISFSVTEKTLTIGDEEYLTPTYKRLNGYDLTYFSSDESIVRVDNMGKISAERAGSAKVTARYSNGTNKAEASVQVTSTFGGYIPELKTAGVDEEVAITLGDTYRMLPYINFNGKRFEDVSLTYSVADKSVAEVTKEGEIVAKAKGKTTVSLEAAWRGLDGANTPTLQKTVRLSIIDNVWFYNGEKTVADEELFILGEFEGVSYKNDIPCDFTVVANGENLAPTIIIDDETVLEKQGERLVAKGFGSTLVTVSAENEEGSFSTTFTVSVRRMEKTVENTVPLFETGDGTYLDLVDGQRKNLLDFIEADKWRGGVDAYQGERALRIENGKIYGVESSSESGRGTAEITVGTAEVIYSFRLETIAKGIYTAEDLKALELSDGKILNGYYELLRDIDATGVEINHAAKNGACFSGVFNGAGHTIKNLALLQNSSMFGVLNATAIVKNFALVNCNATKAFFLAHDTLNDGLTVTDVYISLSEDTLTPRGIMGRMAANSVLKNVVIEYLGDNAQENRNYSERWTWQGLIGSLWKYESAGNYYAQDKKWENVYVVSPFVVAFRTDEKWTGVDQGAVYGYGANETTDIYGNSLETSLHERPNPNLGEHFYTESYCNALFTNLYHYESYADLSNGENDFSSFSSEYWVVYDNQIFWKTDVERKVSVGIYDGETPVSGEIRLSKVGKTLDVKAFVLGKQAAAEVSVSENGYLVWDSQQKALKAVALPRAEAVRVEITVKIKVGEAEILKTLTILLKPTVVEPIQPGGNYNAGDYEDPDAVLVTPIQPGGDYDADDYDAEKMQ